MSNFKSGAGDLDFGGDSDDDGSNEVPEESSEDQRPSGSHQSGSTEDDDSTTSTDSKAVSAEEPATPNYPYFVRRSNVGDERDKRIEIHLREAVAEQEAEFRNALADRLGTDEVAKTDAREFALLAAFKNPEQVAELMEDEGFGELD
ncbi:acyl-CoA dehydrogenase [Haloarcula sp. Atlit-7R]|uniref:acyl-CoA dehydrogenase n=1 Tax=Haloarcula sp. Atlit-7R TaxID=2282125 RepID=UPI000EF156E6|nr:acyl-CoA dehydrogenase [Haloarcula sp. Atlit-7R]RLM94399.1 acyl-CoA dehydrogenase [Haloarcula sp. Atlit-7R]